MASDRQISQLILQVDANVAVAQRSLQDLARVVRQSSGEMNASIDSTVARHAKLGGAFNQTRIAQMELSHVVTASVDAYAAGASPLRILTLEMGRVAEAATFLGGAGGGGVLGKLGGFMSGPWGVAMLFGVTVLGQLFSKMSQGGDAVGALVDKMRQQAKQAEASRQADVIWGNTIDGLIDRNEKLIETLKKRLSAEEDLGLQELQQAKRDEARAEQELTAAKTRLANLQAQQKAAQSDAARRSAIEGGGVASAVGAGLVSQSELARAQQDVVTAQRAVAVARAAISESTISVGQEQGKALADLGAAAELWSKRYISALHGIETANNGALAGSTETITEGFYALDKAMKEAAGAGLQSQFAAARTQAKNLGNELAQGKITAQAYADKMKALAASLEAAASAAKDAKRGAGEFGKQIGFGQAESIAKAAGLTVTSGYRSAADQARLYNDPRYNHPGNPVARPGMSAHNGVNGKWALDIAFAPGLTPQKLRKIYGDQGVSLSAIYKETGHFHIEGSRSQAASAERQAQRDQISGIHQAGSFVQLSDRLDQELQQAQSRISSDYNQRAKIADQVVDSETKKLMDSISEQEALGKAAHDQQGITEAQAGILRAKAHELDAARKSAIEQQRMLQSMEDAQQTADQRYGFLIGDLKFANDMATTQSEHRKIQLEILDITYQQREYDLKILLAKQQLAGDLTAAARTQDLLNRLPAEKAQDQARTRQGTMDPLQAWAKSVPHTAADINEALQSIQVQGLNNLADALTGVITGTESLGKAFKDVARSIVGDIVQMTIKMLIFRAISGIFGGIGGGAGAADIGNANIGSAIYGGGGLTGTVPGYAGGGSFVIGGYPGIDNNVLSLNGERIAMVSQGERLAVIPKTSRISIPQAANGNGPAPLDVRVTVEASEDLVAKASVVADQRIRVAAPQIVRAAAKTTVGVMSRRRLNG